MRIKNTAGYISIESVIVVGFMIALGVFAFQKFYAMGESQTDLAMENVTQVMTVSTMN